MGFAIIWGINLVHVLAGYATLDIGIGIVLLVFYALIQIAYASIMVISARRNYLYDRAKGMLIATAVTTLLSSSCTYWFMRNWR